MTAFSNVWVSTQGYTVHKESGKICTPKEYSKTLVTDLQEMHVKEFKIIIIL